MSMRRYVAVRRNGLLGATDASTANCVDGDLVCKGGRPAGLPHLASTTNWDGAGLAPDDLAIDVDGSIGGRYCC